MQFLLSVIYTVFRWLDLPPYKQNIFAIIEFFSTAFFLTSWFISQFIRIKKQQKVEESFAQIFTKFELLIHKLEIIYIQAEASSRLIIGNLTGGNGFVLLNIINISDEGNTGIIAFDPQSEFPLHDVSVRWIDCNIWGADNNYTQGEYRLDLGTILPRTLVTTQNTVKLDKSRGVNLNIFFNSKAGLHTQLLRMRFLNNRWSIAQRLFNQDGQILMLYIDENYPLNDSDEDWIRQYQKTN